MKKVIVELVVSGQAKEYATVSLADAKEILARKMKPGCRWHVPTWQFDDGTGATLESVLQEKQAEACAAIAAH